MIPSNNNVRIVEVSPRDGLQNIKQLIPTSTKVQLIQKLSQTGLCTIEATSFVSPTWVPQLSDAKNVMCSISPLLSTTSISFPVLVPNMKGLDAAIEAGCSEISIFVSATEGFSMRNINCSVAESILRAETVVEKAVGEGMRVRAYISCVINCPYDGPTPPSQVLTLAKKLLAMGCSEISLGDTTGFATPIEVQTLLTTLLKEIPAWKLAGHFHDTSGRAIENVVAAYHMGIRTFDGSVAGLGGCPYSPGAKGNVATEDLVAEFQGMGVWTGVDFGKLAEIGEWISRDLGMANGSRVGAAIVARQKESKKRVVPQRSVSHEDWRILRGAGKVRV